jgi:chaperonin cofactor prefoldin
MGQIQNAVASIVGSSAIGAIGKSGTSTSKGVSSLSTGVSTVSKEVSTVSKELSSVKEELELVYETLKDGVNPMTGFNLGNTHDAGKADASNANMVTQTANKQVQRENVSARKQQLQTKGGV